MIDDEFDPVNDDVTMIDDEFDPVNDDVMGLSTTEQAMCPCGGTFVIDNGGNYGQCDRCGQFKPATQTTVRTKSSIRKVSSIASSQYPQMVAEINLLDTVPIKSLKITQTARGKFQIDIDTGANGP